MGAHCSLFYECIRINFSLSCHSYNVDTILRHSHVIVKILRMTTFFPKHKDNGRPKTSILTSLFVHTFIIFFAAFAAATANTEEESDYFFKATYKGKHSGIPVTITRTLVREHDIYHYDVIAKGFPGKISEKTDFKLENDILVPLNYHYKQKLFGVAKKKKILFDWDKREAVGTKKGKSRTHQIAPGVLVQSLYQLALIRDLNRNADLLSYTFVKTNKIKNYRFAVIDKDATYVLNDQTVPAWRLMIERTENDTTQTYVTVLPDADFQIAEIHQMEEDGKEYKIHLTELDINPALSNQFFKNSP